MGHMSFLSPNQQCQITEGNSLSTDPNSYFIYQQTPEGVGVAPFMLALQCHYPLLLH